jgi:hypothetical protein
MSNSDTSGSGSSTGSGATTDSSVIKPEQMVIIAPVAEQRSDQTSDEAADGGRLKS